MTSNHPSVSLVAPIYTTVAYLKEFLDSVSENLDFFGEVILVDDANSRDVSDLLETFRREHGTKVLVITLDVACGISEATKLGVAHAKLEFVAFADSDDVLQPGLAVELFPHLDSSVDLLSTDFYFLRGGRGFGRNRSQLKIDSDARADWQLVAVHNLISHLKIVRRSALLEFPWESRFDGVQDAILNFFLIATGARVKLVETLLYGHRVHSQQTSRHVSAALSTELNFERRRFISKFRDSSSGDELEIPKKGPDVRGHLFFGLADSDRRIHAWVPISEASKTWPNRDLNGALAIQFTSGDEAELANTICRLLSRTNARLGLFAVKPKQNHLEFLSHFSGALDFVYCSNELEASILEASLGPNSGVQILW